MSGTKSKHRFGLFFHVSSYVMVIQAFLMRSSCLDLSEKSNMRKKYQVYSHILSFLVASITGDIMLMMMEG